MQFQSEQLPRLKPSRNTIMRLIDIMMFYTIFNITSVISWLPVHRSAHTFLEFLLQVVSTIFFLSHRLLFHITIIETMDIRERGINPVAMTTINPPKEYWLYRMSKSATSCSKVLHATD